MASSENSDDGGQHHNIPNFPVFDNNSNTMREYTEPYKMENEYLRLQLATMSAQKLKAERDLTHKKNDLDKMCHDYAEVLQKYDSMRLRYEEFAKQSKMLADERKLLRDKLQESESEVNTILSERGTVLKENQKLYDKNEALKKEVEIEKRNRDEARQECNLLREKIELMRSRNEFNNKDLSTSKDKFSLVTDLESATQEIERLKKSLDKALTEAAKATQETERAREMRDCAMQEREKIVNERDSVRNLCDEIRKERDTATSKLLAAIRDKDDVIKENEQLNEKIELLINAQTNRNSMWGYPPYEMEPYQQFETERVDVDIARIPSNADLGLILSGGEDDGNGNGNNLVSVVAVEPDSIFAGKLKVNDYIYQINNRDCSLYSKQTVLNAIRSSVPRVSITVRRKRTMTKRVFSVQLNLGSNRNHGLEFESGLYISKIEPNSVAAKETKLSQGDRVLSINNKSVDSFKDLSDISQCIIESRNNILTLICVKDVPDKRAFIRDTRQSNRMTNCSTQTENLHAHTGSAISANSSISNNSNINQNRMSYDFSSDNFFLPPRMSQFGSAASNTTTSPASSKSASKLTGMFQKLRDKMQLSNHKESQENDALAELDRVLDSDQESKSPPVKDSRKTRRKSKQSEKNVGTWPRVTANPSHDNHPGTIVQTRKKSRPRLYQIFPDENEPTGQSENFSFVPPVPTPPSQPPPVSQNATKINPNPMTAGVTRRTLEKYQAIADSSVGTVKPNDRSFVYDQRQPNPINMNRFSLQPQSQHSLDFFLMKPNLEHHSRDLINKSPIYSTGFNQPPLHLPSSKDTLDYFTSGSRMSKFASDNESIPENSVGNTSTLPLNLRNKPMNTQPRVQSQIYGSDYTPLYTQNFLAKDPLMQTHQQKFGRRYPSPATVMPTDLLGKPFDLLPYPPHHSHGSSIDYPYRSKIQTSKEEVPSAFHLENGTFPRKAMHQRIRIPSNQSMASRGSGIKISNGSIDCTSERASPMPSFKVKEIEPTEPGTSKLRKVQIDKVEKMPLGFGIDSIEGGGIFVTSVHENSIASQVGLHVGDQLLEIYGINMRSATYAQAAQFLSPIRDSINMLVQYNPDKCQKLFGSSTDDLSRSGSPTPQNSPQTTRSVMSTDSLQQPTSDMPASSQIMSQSMVSQRSIRSSQLSKASKDFDDSLEHHSNMSSPNNSYKERPRIVMLEIRNSANLGISLLGGNAYGIFVHSIKEGSIADQAGLRVGDQILEYNGTNLRRATAECAAFELAKPADKVHCLVQYNPQKCNAIKDKPGDSFYIRVGFDRTEAGEGELTFKKDETLYVDNTMCRGPGQWRAWKLDEHGHRIEVGVIPSQLKVEDDFRLQGDITDGESTTRRGAARRSFLKRMKFQRSSSRDSKELASFSNTHLSSYLDSSMLSELDPMPITYQRVERLEYKNRPVLVLGPLADCVVDKLTIDFPEQFQRCKINKMRATKEDMEKGLQTNAIADYRRRGSIYECTTIQAINEARTYHCILDICISAIDRLQRNQIHPIVLLIRFKQYKQIKEIADKLSAKAAKEMYEHALKLEADYRQFISAVIPAGVNINHISTQIKEAVDAEQKKILWVPVGQ